MKTVSLLLNALIFVFVLGMSTANAQESSQIAEATLKTSAKCGVCKNAIETALTKVEGVESAQLNLETKDVVVKYDEKATNVDNLKKALADVGYDAEEKNVEKRNCPKTSPCCKKKEAKSCN